MKKAMNNLKLGLFIVFLFEIQRNLIKIETFKIPVVKNIFWKL